jgi:hypothetical protein
MTAFSVLYLSSQKISQHRTPPIALRSVELGLRSPRICFWWHCNTVRISPSISVVLALLALLNAGLVKFECPTAVVHMIGTSISTSTVLASMILADSDVVHFVQVRQASGNIVPTTNSVKTNYETSVSFQFMIGEETLLIVPFHWRK